MAERSSERRRLQRSSVVAVPARRVEDRAVPPPGVKSNASSDAPTQYHPILGRWMAWERACARWVHSATIYPWVLLLFVVVSWLGDGILWVALMITVPWWGGTGGMAAALHMLALGAVNLGIYSVLKKRTARPRPFVACPGIRACARSLDEFSFPSGHTMHAVAFSWLLQHYHPAVAGPFWMFTALVAASRVVLGLHYPSDVAIGAALGLFMAQLSLMLIGQ